MLANIFELVPIIFGGVWALRFISSPLLRMKDINLGLKRDYDSKPTVEVLISCFNEGKAIYKTINSVASSNYPIDRLKISVFDDQSSDDSFQWIEKAAIEHTNVIGICNEVNKGKGRTIASAVKASQADVIVTIDSDVILDSEAIKEMVACFSDPKIALVGGIVGISNPDENALTAFQVFVYYVFFRLAKIPEAYFRSVACVSGCLSAIRRSVFLEILPIIEARNWFGVPSRYGEDRFITHQTLLKGYQTFTSLQAKCWTVAPNNFKAYWGQQLRWRRSGVGDFFRTLHHAGINIRTVSFAGLYTYFFSPLSIFLMAVLVMQIPFTGFLANEWLLDSLKFLALAFFVIAVINRLYPEQAIKQNPYRVTLYGGWWVIRNMLMTPLAMLTLDSDGWGGAREPIKEDNKSE